MSAVPTDISALDALRRGDLVGLKELRLSGTCTEFPRDVFGLADTLELLDLSHCSLTDLPRDLGRLRKLRVLFCSNNRFDRLPPVLGDCPSLQQIGFRGCALRDVPGEALPETLRWLTLTDNQIAHLPPELGRRHRLQKLMLSGNRLTHLPTSLADATKLELIRLASNDLDDLPRWLVDLPSLAWISWSDNPFEPKTTATSATPISWNELAVGDCLGEGASGRIHRATWRSAGQDARDVALKLFKGAMTSDGLPEREMAACLTAGDHDGLVGGIGRLVDHPDANDGLVMPLVPTDWRVLAGPPSLKTCSRDVYDNTFGQTSQTMKRIASTVASAVAHLHTRSVLHGDLYAHNVLWDGCEGQSVLSDFGAASVLPTGRMGEALQRIEVRAWGLLLGELLDHCSDEPGAIAHFRALEQACVQPDPSARPLLAEVLTAIR